MPISSGSQPATAMPRQSAKRRQPALLGLARLHQHARARPVGELGSVAGGDEAAFRDHLPVLEDRLQLFEIGEHRLRAVALVALQCHIAARGLAGRLVDDDHAGGQRRDLGIEAPLCLRLRGALLRIASAYSSCAAREMP